MIITNCPKCGSMNITTAGVCANCGWSQFAQVTTVSTGITGEIEIMLSGKALLDDYKRLLFENNSLTVRIAELEGKINQLTACIAELERDFDMLFRSAANKQSRKNTQTLTFEYGMESER